ncbi:MAG: MBL fold metallo-hydrolase [Elusimicrobia bacterium]|nr:MBL fold metallo-hydrolase [Elusimicrobiota bacterium]
MKKAYTSTLVVAFVLLCTIVLYQASVRNPRLALAQTAGDLRDAPNPINGDAKEVLQSLKDDGSAANVPAVPEPVEVQSPAGSVRVSVGSGLNVYFVNVFQGDAEYIELPNGKNVLIDAGPAPSEHSQYKTPMISNFLTKHGVTKIDHLVLTHPHADHYGGMKWVFENLQVDNFYDTRVDNSDADGDNLVREQAKKEPGCVVHYPAEGDTLDWAEGVKIKVLNSCPNRDKSSMHKPDTGAFLNNCSIVLKISRQNSSALFMGDSQGEVETRLEQTYGKGLKSDILKVGHHGSEYSSSELFLKKVKPKEAYIEVGKYNDYGHPTQGALSRLKAAGAEIHRTDKDGTEEVPLEGKSR